jgi:hypothetical protein
MNGQTSSPFNLHACAHGCTHKHTHTQNHKEPCQLCLVPCYDLYGEKYDNSINNLTATSFYYLMFQSIVNEHYRLLGYDTALIGKLIISKFLVASTSKVVKNE